MKRKKYKIVIILCILILFQMYFNIVITKAKSDDVYDVILFWGQSNMLGSCGIKDGEKKADSRYNYKNNTSVSNFSKITGIDTEILKNTQIMNWCRIMQEPNTAYEYMYLDNKLSQISANTKNLGEVLQYNKKTKKLEKKTKNPYALQKSYGTNMIPQFCKTYYQNTGHKVVAVFCANGGETINKFLPSNDTEYDDQEDKMLYESMVEKYTSAINYLKRNNYKIGQKLYVCFQGESDAINNNTKDYKRVYKKVHDNLKKDTGISKGAIVETARNIGTRYAGVKRINKAQQELIKENTDIILGSDYAYKHYVPDETNYNSTNFKTNIFVDSKGKKLSYETAYKYASYSVCYPTDNTVHFTSAALSQIGKEVAENFTKLENISILKAPSKLSYIQNYEKLNLTGGILQLKYVNGQTKELNMTDNNIKCSGFNNSNIGKNTITLEYKGKTVKFDVNIIKKSIEGIEIATKPDKVNYIQNCEKLDLTGGFLTVKYNDKTTDKIELTNENIKIEGFDNTKIGTNTIKVTYQGKTTTFDINIISKSIESIEIATKPDKVNYIQNCEKLDLTGGFLTVKYNDKTTDKIELTNENIKIEGFDNTKIGTNTIKVTYQGKTTSFDINIISKSIESIEINTLPTKKNYIQNYENLDLTGGILAVKYNDETTDKISLTNEMIEVEGFDNKKIGENIVTIIYQGKTTTFNVTIIAKSVVSIELNKKPDKLYYIQNDENLDLSGGTLKIKYNDKTEEIIDLTEKTIKVKGFSNKEVGINTIIIEYKGKIETFNINIIPNEKEEDNTIADNTIVDNTIADKQLPKAGSEMIILVILIAVSALTILFFYKNRKYKDVK